MESSSQNRLASISPENDAARSRRNYETDIANDGSVKGQPSSRGVSSCGADVVDSSMLGRMLKLTLHVISRASYSRSFNWNSSKEGEARHKLSLIQSLRSLVNHIMLLFIFPIWVFKLPLKRLQETQLAFLLRAACLWLLLLWAGQELVVHVVANE